MTTLCNFAWLAVTAGALVGASACEEERSCTLIGCGPSSVKLVRDTWPLGAYELEASYTSNEEVTIVCSFVVGDEQRDEADCTTTRGEDRYVALHVFEGARLELYDSPSAIELTLRYQDEVIFGDEISPDYETSSPNGPGCGDCRTADVEVEVEITVADAGSPWTSCNGSRGMALSCDSYGARTLEGTRFDAERGCFEEPVAIDDVCAVPTYCPGGSGALVCIAQGESVYAAIALWGEELSDGSHHSDGADVGSTLTDDEAEACRELFGTSLDAGTADAITLGNLFTGSYELRPACASLDD